VLFSAFVLAPAHLMGETPNQDCRIEQRSDEIVVSTQAGSVEIEARPVPEGSLDVFAGPESCHFVCYDDDGRAYAYENGIYYGQAIEAALSADGATGEVAMPQGSFQSALQTYSLHIHGVGVAAVSLNGSSLSKATSEQIDTQGPGAWTAGQDKFGAVTTIRVRADQASNIEIH